MTEQEAYLILNAVHDLGAVRIKRLVDYFGSALQVLQAHRDELFECGLILAEGAQNILHFSKDKFLQDEYNLMRQRGVIALTIADQAFPCSLRDLDDGPVAVYVKGQTTSLDQLSLAIVGSRGASYYGTKSADTFARAFARAGVTVVSGLARGIDTAAHLGSLEAGGRTVAVVGCGFNHIYPKENLSLMERIAQQGAVVSEFAFDMPPLKYNFPWRNRIISALSRAVIVIEARDKSGALITADYALAQNKDVYAVPSNIDNEAAMGSNLLIRDGARVALNPDDILSQVSEGYLPLFPQEAKPVLLLSDEQAQVYPCITHEPVHLDELVKRSGLSISTLMNIALSLELKRAIRQLPGQYYVRI